ncbi:MAG: hypothetical protein CFE44_12435, partial [Burkholderiales bacterium PBB4]
AERTACQTTEALQMLGHADRRAAVQRCLAALKFTPAPSVSVEVLGLWDTVEALGFPDWGARLLHKANIRPLTIDVDTPNPRYGDQLCNVRLALQALSIDDNREWIFTPLPLARSHVFNGCPVPDGQHLLGTDGRVLPGRLKEVWFSGAHSDVGGGYADSLMSGVSLNWMLEQLAGTGLVPAGTRVREDRHGRSHDPEDGLLAGAGYHAIARNIAAWPLAAGQQPEFSGSLCVHASVFERRRALALQIHENAQLRLLQAQSVCLEPDTTDGPSAPQRLREVIGGRPPCGEAPQQRIQIEQFPACKGMQ